MKEIYKEKNSRGSKKFWRYVKSSPGYVMLNDNKSISFTKRDGTIAINEKENMEAIEEFWVNINSKVLSNEKIVSSLPRLKNPETLIKEFSVQSVRNYIIKLKENKATGVDDIPNEFLKFGGNKLAKILTKCFNEIIETGIVPEDWKRARVHLLHKGGRLDKHNLGNYRPISIISNICKVFCGLLNKRLNDQLELDGILGQGQNGFRRDRRGTDNLFSL